MSACRAPRRDCLRAGPGLSHGKEQALHFTTAEDSAGGRFIYARMHWNDPYGPPNYVDYAGPFTPLVP